MESLVVQGVSRMDCVGKIMQKYGPRYYILRTKDIRIGGFLGLFTREGVEVEFYIPPEPNRNFAPFQPNAPIPFHTPAAAAVPAGRQDNSTLNFEEEKKRLLSAAGKNPDQVISHVAAHVAAHAAAQASAQAAADASTRQILDELREIKTHIAQGVPRAEEHPSLIRAAELLKLNDFSENYTAAILDRARKELPLETLDDFDAAQNRLLEWIGESIAIYRESEYAAKRVAGRGGRIVALVGPTGVGKTTTIAKLAAINGVIRSPPLAVRIISIDTFRIGAPAQIEPYAEIMKIPLSILGKPRELKKEIGLYAEEADLFLVDTIGRSPSAAKELGEMKELLDACGSRTEVHLALSASTKTGDIDTILRQFEPFNYRSVILTKLDETSHIGNVISALSARKKSVSYITDGQSVPDNIRKATVVRFLTNLEGFTVNREKIEQRFPVDEADQYIYGDMNNGRSG